MRTVIHELINTVPGRDEDYMASIDSLRQFPQPWRRASQHLGLYRSTMAGGPWPKVLNLWEHNWAGVRKDLVGQFQDSARDKGLEGWWSANVDLRSGGEDRLLIPSEFSPTIAGLTAAGRCGQVFLHQILDVGPLGVEPCLERYGAILPDLESSGGFLVGAFRTLWRPSEVVAVTGHHDAAALMSATANGGPLERARGAYRSIPVSMVMLPARSNPFGPERAYAASKSA